MRSSPVAKQNPPFEPEGFADLARSENSVEAVQQAG